MYSRMVKHIRPIPSIDCLTFFVETVTGSTSMEYFIEILWGESNVDIFGMACSFHSEWSLDGQNTPQFSEMNFPVLH
jgi:hypothetical protein